MGFFDFVRKSVSRIGSKITSAVKVGVKSPFKALALVGHKAASELHSVDTVARKITAPVTKSTGIDVYDFTPMGVVTSLGADVLDEGSSGFDLANKAAHGQKVSNAELNTLGNRVVKSGGDYAVHRISGMLGGKFGSRFAKKAGSKLAGNIAGKIASQRIGKQMSNGH